MKRLLLVLVLITCIDECPANGLISGTSRRGILRRNSRSEYFTGTNEFGRTYHEQREYEDDVKAREKFRKDYPNGTDLLGRNFDERKQFLRDYTIDEFFGVRFGEPLQSTCTNTLPKPFGMLTHVHLTPTKKGRLGEVILTCDTTNLTYKCLKREISRMAALLELAYGVVFAVTGGAGGGDDGATSEYEEYTFRNTNIVLEVGCMYFPMKGTGELWISARRIDIIENDKRQRKAEALLAIERRQNDVHLPFSSGMGLLAAPHWPEFSEIALRIDREFNTEWLKEYDQEHVFSLSDFRGITKRVIDKRKEDCDREKERIRRAQVERLEIKDLPCKVFRVWDPDRIRQYGVDPYLMRLSTSTLVAEREALGDIDNASFLGVLFGSDKYSGSLDSREIGLYTQTQQKHVKLSFRSKTIPDGTFGIFGNGCYYSSPVSKRLYRIEFSKTYADMGAMQTDGVRDVGLIASRIQSVYGDKVEYCILSDDALARKNAQCANCKEAYRGGCTLLLSDRIEMKLLLVSQKYDHGGINNALYLTITDVQLQKLAQVEGYSELSGRK